jgi:hypothetical protein
MREHWYYKVDKLQHYEIENTKSVEGYLVVFYILISETV